MRSVLYALSFLAVMGLGFWAYRENYKTQDAQGEVTDLQNEIASLREALAVQRAEWAYLNRPSRLRDLATINFDRLGLLPMEPEQFGTAAMVSMPPPPITSNIDVNAPTSVQGILPADPEGESTP
jgi:hypothetical protein